MEPIVNNDTPANRAINRRVDITLFNPVATPALIRPSK
jgi:flagellar motor protein MotB